MDAAEVHRWVAEYERAWRTPGTEALSQLFTEDVTYLPSPWAEPVVGMAGLAEFWEAERDSPDEGFAMTSEVVAVDPDRSTAVVRVTVDYDDDGRWRNLWVVQLAEDPSTGSGGAGRCRAFEEWPFAPRQPDGH